MEYSDEELLTAFAADEVARYERMQHERGPDYAVLSLEDNDTDLDSLSPDDVDGAAYELAAERGMDPAVVLAQVDALAGGERDTVTRAYALAALAGMDAEDALALTVTQKRRDALAEKGKGFALPGGAYPIPDAKHLGVAKAYFKQGKYAGHSPAQIKAHINAAAKRLGLPGLDEDDEDEDSTDREAQRQRKPKPKKASPVRGQRQAAEGGEPGGGEGPSGAGPGGELAATVAKRLMVRTADGIHNIALTDGQAAEVLGMTGETLSPVDRIMRRHPELFLANDDARNYNPAVSAFEQAPDVLLKPPPFEVHEVGARDDGDPTDADGGRTAAIIARLQREHPGEFGRQKQDALKNVSYPPHGR